MNKTIIFGIAAIIALTAGIYAQQLTQQPVAAQQSADILPEFAFPDLDGKQRSISEWRDKVLVINFWATWCPPCLKEIPEFIELQNELGEKGLQFIGIAIEERQPVDEFLEFAGINYPVLIADDAGIDLSQRLGNIVNTVPFTIVVDRQGNVVHRQFGEFSKKLITEIINPLF